MIKTLILKKFSHPYFLKSSGNCEPKIINVVKNGYEKNDFHNFLNIIEVTYVQYFIHVSCFEILNLSFIKLKNLKMKKKILVILER